MQSFADAWDRIETFLLSGIAGSEFTPLRLLTVITLTLALVWVTRRVTRWFVENVLARRGFDIGMREALGVIARYIIITLGTLVILQSAGVDLTSLNVLVGAVGVGLGFGLQNITSNFFSGLILLFERPIKMGDRVEIGGVVGEVREIGARATTIVTDESVAMIVPNSQFVSERVTNWSRPGKLQPTYCRFTCRIRPTPNWCVRCCLRPRPVTAMSCPSPQRKSSLSKWGSVRSGFSCKFGAPSI